MTALLVQNVYISVFFFMGGGSTCSNNPRPNLGRTPCCGVVDGKLLYAFVAFAQTMPHIYRLLYLQCQKP